MARVAFACAVLAALAACSATAGSGTRRSGHQASRAPAAPPHRETSVGLVRGSSARLAGLAPDSGEAQWTHSRQELRLHPVQRPRPDHRRQRRAAPGRLDVLDRHRPRARGRAAGGREYDVRRHALPQHALRARPHASGRSAQVEVHAHADARGAGGGLLRRREPGRGLLGRPDLLQHAGRAHRRGGCRHGAGGLEHEAGGDQSGREHHHGPAGGEGQGAGGKQRR